LGVNRPHYVESALWQARTGARDRSDDVERWLAAILGPLVAAAPDQQRFGVSALTDETAQTAARALADLIWPAPATVAADAFVAEALALYRPAEREKRARRLATDIVEP
jgi:hypothetical protein